MKLTFLIPPVIDGKKPAERTAGCTHVVYLAPNIYELTVVSLLEKEGRHDISYCDFVYKSNKKTYQEYRRFINGDSSKVYYIWGVNLSFSNDLMAVDIIRQCNPTAYVVFMGPGPTYFKDKCLCNDRDVVVRGEPEQTVLELTRAIENSQDLSTVAGISYMEKGEIKNNPPRQLMKTLDELPFPARHFIAHHRYFNPKLKTGPYTTAVTSRNCPYHCIFCVPSSLTFAREIEYRKVNGVKPPISFRTIASIDAEMKELHEAGYKAIGFMDDNFIWNEQRTADICRIMRKYEMVWGCQARVDAITENIAKELSISGCKYVDLGVESFDKKILEYVKKGITADQIYNAIAILKKYKVPVKLNILIGSSPYETKETLRHTLREAKKLDVDQVMFNIVSPFPGTEFYDIVKSNGWLKTEEYVPTDVQRESILNYPSLNSDQMENILFLNNISYFLSPRFIIKQLKRFSTWRDFSDALRALKIKLFG